MLWDSGLEQVKVKAGELVPGSLVRAVKETEPKAVGAPGRLGDLRADA